MKNYYSITHATSNENGQEQLELEHEKSFLRWLFRRPAKIEVYVYDGKGLLWKDKDTCKKVNADKYFEINKVIRSLESSRYLQDKLKWK